MAITIGLWLGLLLGAISDLTREQPPAVELKVGDLAPAFSLPGIDGKTYRLDDYKGRKMVVLAWYPKAFTPGCIAECQSLRVAGESLRVLNVEYFMASTDHAKKNEKFGKTFESDFPILSDESTQVARQYGVVTDERKMPFRWTFYIGPDGKIWHIDKHVKPETHGEDIAAKLKELALLSQTSKR